MSNKRGMGFHENLWDAACVPFGVDALDPFNCPHELSVVDIGGGKTECELMKCWTNCREVGHCTNE